MIVNDLGILDCSRIGRIILCKGVHAQVVSVRHVHVSLNCILESQPSQLPILPTDHTSPSPLSTAATIGIGVSGTVVLVVVLLLVVIFVLARKHLHSKQTAGELYETSDAIGMKENEAYGTNAQTQNITTAANEMYGCVGDIPVVENVAYTLWCNLY